MLPAVAAIAAAVALAPHAQTQDRDVRRTVIVNGHEAAEGEVLVKLRTGVTAARRQQLEQQLQADVSEPIGGAMHRMRSRAFDVATLLAFLRTHPDVAYAEPNYVLHTTITRPTDPLYDFLWGLENFGQLILQYGVVGADIHAIQAWDITTGSRANVVAVVDTGIDYTHPDLAANVWSAPSSFTVNIGGTSITCAAGTHGFNAITKTCDPMDDNDHGTHVSGTIGAVANNGQGVAGVNWIASIMGSKFLDASGSGYTSDAVNAIEFTIQAKAAFAASSGANVRVLSNSWSGGGFSQALLDEINKANTNDMLFVAAAGNNGWNNSTYPTYPANYSAPNVIAVAATDNTDQLAYFSDYGPLVHLAAPGVQVLSTTRNNTYQFFSGTSMATPHVSGAAALILSKCALSTASLKTTILNTVDVVGALTGWVATNGRLNVYRALQSCAPPTISIAASAISADATTLSLPVTVTSAVVPVANLTLSATSSNQGVVPNANITFTGTGASRTMLATVPPNTSGTTTITTTVSDGTRTTSATTLLTVYHVDAAPTMSTVANQIINENGSSGAIPITVNDVDSPVGSLALAAFSSNTTLLPNANIVFGGSGASRTVTITPAAGKIGSALIALNLSDGTATASQTLWVNVIPPNTLVVDTFTDVNGTQIPSHAPDMNATGHGWTVTGGPPTPTISSGSLAAATGGGHMQATIDAGISDIDLATDYYNNGGPGMGALAFRETDVNNLLALVTYQNTLQLYARQGGNWAMLASQPIPPFASHTSHRLEARAVGSTVQGWWDGQQILQVVTSLQQTATRHGVDWNTSYDATSLYDNVVLQDARPVVTGVTMAPSPVNVVVGSTQTVTAQATDASGAPINNVNFTWTSGNTNVATLLYAGVGVETVNGVAPGTTTMTATAPNGVSATITVNVLAPPTVTSVVLTPTPVSVNAFGTQSVSAQAIDQNGLPMSGVTFAWTSGNASIATVASTGAATAMVTGVATGSTTLTATAPNGVSATVAVTVAPVPPTWLVSDTFTGGSGTLLTAHTPDINQTGHAWTVTGGPPTPTIANGRAVTAAGGGHMQLTIDAGIADIDLATDYVAGSGPGMGAIAFRETDANNLLALVTNQNVLQLYARQGGNWGVLASQSIGAVTPGSTHRLQVHAVGSTVQGWWDGHQLFQVTTTIQQTATRHGLDWNTSYDPTSAYDNLFLQDARPTVATVNVSPSSVTMFAGGAQAMSAQAADATNAPIAGVAFTWSTGDSTIATVASTGAGTATVTGVAPGTTTLTATAPNGVAGSVTITVQSPPTVASVHVTPTSISVSSVGNQPVGASATDGSGLPVNGLTFTWSVADTTIARVVPLDATSATVYGVAAGSTTLTATAPNGVSQTVPVTVTGIPSTWLVSDTFTDTNGTLLTAHTPDINQTGHAWTVTGGPPTPTIGNGRAGTTAGGGHMQLTIDAGIADIDLAADYLVGSGPGMGALVFRETDTNNLLALVTNQNVLQLYSRQGGAWGLLASHSIAALTPGSTHRIEVRAVGSSVQGIWDNVVVLQATTTVQQTATRHGLDWNTSYDPTSAYDNVFLQDARPTVTTVSVTPSPVAVYIGGPQAVTAQALDATNAPIAGVAFTWSGRLDDRDGREHRRRHGDGHRRDGRHDDGDGHGAQRHHRDGHRERDDAADGTAGVRHVYGHERNAADGAYAGHQPDRARMDRHRRSPDAHDQRRARGDVVGRRPHANDD